VYVCITMRCSYALGTWYRCSERSYDIKKFNNRGRCSFILIQPVCHSHPLGLDSDSDHWIVYRYDCLAQFMNFHSTTTTVRNCNVSLIFVKMSYVAPPPLSSSSSRRCEKEREILCNSTLNQLHCHVCSTNIWKPLRIMLL
jgi:hypothetical protein